MRALAYMQGRLPPFRANAMQTLLKLMEAETLDRVKHRPCIRRSQVACSTLRSVLCLGPDLPAMLRRRFLNLVVNAKRC